MVFKQLIRPVLFQGDPERMHDSLTRVLAGAGYIALVRKTMRSLFSYSHPALETTVAGIHFPNPVGLAPGFDKHCRLVDIVPAFGFGFIEVGTITGQAQEGNPKPRLIRLVEDKALINRMGFNNIGADAIRERLLHVRKRLPLGINIGKSKVVAIENAVDDYVYSFERLSEFADYVVVNVSSPNTPGLRELQEKEQLMKLLLALQRKNSSRKPLFVKIAPDLTFDQLDDVLDVVRKTKLSGIIATNTTVARDGLSVVTFEAGGLSGKPLREKATEFVRRIYSSTSGKLPIIGVGGIFTAADAYEKIKAGASLVQVYTGFIYEGPMVAQRINEGLVWLLKKDGLKSVGEAVGVKI
jgi:dihydroorotate dehydrogenase